MDYSTLKTKVLNDIKSDASLKSALNVLQKKINNNTAKYADVNILAKRLGSVTSKHLKLNSMDVTSETMSEFADAVLAPVYESMQKTSIIASKQVQRIYNQNAQIGLKPAEVVPDQSRIKHIKDRFRDASEYEDVSFLLGADVAENISRGAVTDSIKANARQFDDAGIETYVMRIGAGCCAWCDSVTGTYSLDNVPSDFWKVHKGCTCSIEYKTRNKRTKITYSTEGGKITKNTEEV